MSGTDSCIHFCKNFCRFPQGLVQFRVCPPHDILLGVISSISYAWREEILCLLVWALVQAYPILSLVDVVLASLFVCILQEIASSSSLRRCSLELLCLIWAPADSDLGEFFN